MDDIVFRVVALSMLIVMKIIRLRTRTRADLTGTGDALKRNLTDTLLLFPLTILIQLSIVVYAVLPQLVSWAQVSFPIWLRWTGVPLGIGALCLLAWADHELGKNFSMTLRLREGHTLVTRGPYRWIRHPIYSAGLLFGVSAFLVSANLCVGVTWIGGCSLLYARRIPREESMMLSEFGDEYREYMRHTGRLLPRWSAAA